ncbi:dual oxidase maturation factor 1 [Callorhinchus milii]|uniref:Dual oxidase maturation factor 1-like n=1 Tax=Callorhinchus milii TaxID=7868 RepID=V9KXI2_CALMI|nr:dual oxidase maturation factor 1 [Callorhinchus milii]|eukprot:gi/632939001/ref/XP_007907245.1/ PREDICTED: dual oxidase maturation factor 1-like [Callorhinchus milii]
MTLYDGISPFYASPRVSAGFNTIEIVIILIFLIFFVAFLIVLAGIRGSERLTWLLQICLSLFIGAVIVVVNFTNNWESGYARVSTNYKSFNKEKVDAEVGLHIGLAGINVTLRGIPENQLNETINYNEEFLWQLGSSYEGQYQDGLERGLPNPILYLAEKFTPSSPCGVHLQYRVCSYYASATMWVALCGWLLSNILLKMQVILTGAYMLLVTGCFMIFSLISFGSTRNVVLCQIQFDQVKLETALGPSFWLALVAGLLCFIIGITIIVLNFVAPTILRRLFLLNGDNDEDDFIKEDHSGKVDKSVSKEAVPQQNVNFVV